MEKAAQYAGLKKGTDVWEKTLSSFYVDKLGANVESTQTHKLIGKGFYHQWLNHQNAVKEVLGRIVECTKNNINGRVHFKVAFDRDVDRSLGDGTIAFWDHLDEASAWGGYLAYLQKTNAVDKIASFSGTCHVYIVPNNRKVGPDGPNARPKISFEVKGFNIELEVRTSAIEGAGLGLWLKCTPGTHTGCNKRCLLLGKGELVDLGVYGPLRLEDVKKGHVIQLKNYLFCGKPEDWSFDVPGGVVDMTDDTTGDLHLQAIRNSLIYVNETDGHASPVILASHDPEGSVHYYLGSNHHDVSIEANGELFELKIDYGPNYEKVRVKHGYQRVRGVELEVLQQSINIQHEAVWFVREFKSLPPGEISEVVDFLESLVEKLARSPRKLRILERALLAAVTFQCRVKDIRSQLHDVDDDASAREDGVRRMTTDRLHPRLHGVIMCLCGLFGNQKELMNRMSTHSQFPGVLADALGLEDPETLRTLKPEEFHARIESL